MSEIMKDDGLFEDACAIARRHAAGVASYVETEMKVEIESAHVKFEHPCQKERRRPWLLFEDANVGASRGWHIMEGMGTITHCPYCGERLPDVVNPLASKK